MIVGSLLLILIAVGLLVFGLAQGSSAMLVGSIVASLLAAVALVVGARQAAAARAGARTGDAYPGGRSAGDGFDDTDPYGEPPPGAGPSVGDQAEAYLAEPVYAGRPRDGARAEADRQGEPQHGSYPAPPAHQPDEYAPREHPPPAEQRAATIPAQDSPSDDADPADEPAPQQVPAGDAARVARMSTEVLVIDGRPRYHVAGCVHLLGRGTEPLPVSEAVELGFTPCGLCEPDSALLADARRV